MSKRSHCQSALFIGTEDDDDGDDAALLVVGGQGGNSKEAALLTNRPPQARGERGNRGGKWRWRQLNPMQKGRPWQPGLVLLGRGRVLVCGGGGGDSCGTPPLTDDCEPCCLLPDLQRLPPIAADQLMEMPPTRRPRSASQSTNHISHL